MNSWRPLHEFRILCLLVLLLIFDTGVKDIVIVMVDHYILPVSTRRIPLPSRRYLLVATVRYGVMRISRIVLVNSVHRIYLPLEAAFITWHLLNLLLFQFFLGNFHVGIFIILLLNFVKFYVLWFISICVLSQI